MLHKNLKEDEIIDSVRSGDFFRVVKVDIFSAEEAQKKYHDLNHPPIYRHIEIEKEMINESFRDYAEARYRKFPLKQQLGLTFHANEIILASPLLKFYFENGLVVKKVHFCIEYTPDKCFRPFIDSLVKMRIEATEENNKQKTMLAKLMMNSSWGRMAMNLKNRRKTTYLRSRELKDNKNYLIDSACHLYTEYDIDL